MKVWKNEPINRLGGGLLCMQNDTTQEEIEKIKKQSSVL